MPTSFRYLWQGWKGIAAHIGDFQARLILTLFYFTVTAPVGAVLSIIGDPLRLRLKGSKAGWMRRSREEAGLSSARRQY